MNLLYGNYEVTIDEKNRLLVPSALRNAINPETDGEGLFLVPRANGKLWLYPDKYYNLLADRIKRGMAPGEDGLKFNRLHFSLVHRVELDKQGRILLPEKDIHRAGLQREVAILGVGDHMELWNRPAWAAEEADLLAKQAEIDEKARQAQAGI